MKSIKISLTVVLSLFINALLFSTVPPPPSTTTATCWPPPCVPIDGGLVFLILAGATLGAVKIYNFRKKTQGIS